MLVLAKRGYRGEHQTLRYHELKTYRDMVEKNQRYASNIRELSVELITELKLLKDLNTYSHE